MKISSTRIAVLWGLIAFLCGCKWSDPQENQARTYYESLNLESPEAAVETFSHAFQREDYDTIYLVLSPYAQVSVANKINTLNYSELIMIDNLAETEYILADAAPFKMLDEWEHSTGIYLFDEIMIAAKQHSAFLIDLEGDVSILHTEPFEDEHATIIDVYTNVEGIDDIVVFRTEQAPSGRWRVQQVILSGGDEDSIPWSVPTE